ncbi:MAG: hypothetical protein GC186_09870 [Rhodobacteraceae bacterium]|nr:hypothetical protein [Paracoccaceae bacterium]
MKKITDRQKYAPKLKFGVKRYLFNLNLDLDAIKREIEFNRSYYFLSGHSITIQSDFLSDVERFILFLEDRRYFVHFGFEFRSIPRAIKRWAKGRGLGGMSTIEQQVVRIVTQRNARTVNRKFTEILLAIGLNAHFSKREIFDYYIHFSYFGYKLQGCEVAARYIFGSSAAALAGKDAALLASLLPLPLPKAVYVQLGETSRGESRSANEIIALGDRLAPMWSSRIRHRVDLATKNQAFSPKNL